ncbi:protein of unknown function (plasmid) [Methylocella tundrae]|uniref:Uncharacterized protein n=1 Tax=Methylocella tundrae TaxID=227605 RepID=A0A4U8Z7X7_METTU|nr:hypothetical protein [Methylocella tundrae]VFU16568.1 protein of unknown function [Methylocella tundrae]
MDPDEVSGLGEGDAAIGDEADDSLPAAREKILTSQRPLLDRLEALCAHEPKA